MVSVQYTQMLNEYTVGFFFFFALGKVFGKIMEMRMLVASSDRQGLLQSRLVLKVTGKRQTHLMCTLAS